MSMPSEHQQTSTSTVNIVLFDGTDIVYSSNYRLEYPTEKLTPRLIVDAFLQDLNLVYSGIQWQGILPPDFTSIDVHMENKIFTFYVAVASFRRVQLLD